MQKRRQLMLNMHQSLSAVLFPGYRRRVLGMLLLHPEESLHGREIARRTGLPAGTLTRELKRLAEVGLLNRQRRGNQLVYSANRDSPIFEELAGILRKTSGLADVVAEALEPVTDRVDVAFIFGSVARAAETQGSDVDVLIIGTIDFGTVVDAAYGAATTGEGHQPEGVFRARVEGEAERKESLRVGCTLEEENLPGGGREWACRT
jgi:predicted nucleotidyltransferase